MIKVMIIDDSAVVRETVSNILSEEKDMVVVAVAADPLIALKKLEIVFPDVIVLDLEMPRMDGLTFLKQLKDSYNIPVVICSAAADSSGLNPMNAMEYGVTELIAKPAVGTKRFLEESRIRICDAIRAAYSAEKKTPVSAKNSVLPEKTEGMLSCVISEKVCVVGASTGGTEALRVFLQMLPETFPGVVIVQHMPEKFTKSFAERLDCLCRISVSEAKDNDTVLPGHVLIAPGNKHTLLKRDGSRYYVEVKDGPLVSRHRPSVNVLFRSAARYAGKNAIGVIMTGMGDDGADGMLEMHRNGAFTIAQDEKSCVVFGMPKEAIKLGGVDEIVPLEEIAGTILKKLK
ncbi:MAG: chemotaxis response regulator protein-glutamate methylesterase [Spirochaetaceae bacterium]|nr:chemotaxis response regulator protein-glutamate methylesterase [Spirochaetaceae bacterium]